MIRVSAPGKLCIAGEWAVLETGNPLIVTAIDKRVFTSVEKSNDRFIHISIRDFGIEELKAFFDGRKLEFKRALSGREEEKTRFLKSALEIALRYLGRAKTFDLRTWGEERDIKIEGETETIGFGASAASVVSVIAGLFIFYGKDIKKKESQKEIYKLSAIAHYLAQGKVGSGFDVAASTFGGLFVYKRFDPEWLKKELGKNKNIQEIVKKSWPGFYMEPLPVPDKFNLLIGWTGKASSTAEMVKRLYRWKRTNIKEHQRITMLIKGLVEELIENWKAGNQEKILELIRANERYLRKLGKRSGINIETKSLRQLSQIANKNGGAGKLSGAGGGDCGIAVTFNPENTERIKQAWQRKGISYVRADLSSGGLREEKIFRV